jgi:hypothetical protein
MVSISLMIYCRMSIVDLFLLLISSIAHHGEEHTGAHWIHVGRLHDAMILSMVFSFG